MIAPGQHGKNLRDIPEQCFDYGFDREDRWPGLVLASTVTVPNGNTDGWRLATQSCGGFSCNEFQAAVLPLPVRPEMLRFLETVAEEEFWHCCKVSDEAAFCLIQRPYISKTLLT
ncbi:hypothetical protein ACN2AY_26780, partial [Klebsiella pneumoniae]